MKCFWLPLISFLFQFFISFSQEKPYPIPRQAIFERRVVPYSPIREADMMWSRTVWRKLDLREKLNLPLYFPIERISERRSLIQVIFDGVKEGSLAAFSPISESFERQLTLEEISGLLVGTDTIMVEDPDMEGRFLSKKVKAELDLASITELRIKEEWFFDRQRSVLDVRIVGLLPVKKEIIDDEVRSKPLFWIYFPEARAVFANAAIFNRHNDAARISLDDIFSKRMFSSYIYKESNVYDRTIADYSLGQDALLEADKIKKSLIEMEADYWEY
jgi:gliding motility associated protien GldN